MKPVDGLLEWLGSWLLSGTGLGVLGVWFSGFIACIALMFLRRIVCYWHENTYI